MGFGSHHVSSPGFCFSTEDYNEWVNKHYPNNNDDEGYLDEKLLKIDGHLSKLEKITTNLNYNTTNNL